MTRPGDPPPPPPPDPPPLPVLPVLEYHTPKKPPNREISGVLVRFGAGVFCGMIVATVFTPHPGPASWFVIILAVVLSTAGFLIANAVRRAILRKPVRERNPWVTLLAGAGCVAGPVVVQAALEGHVETLPWVLTSWLIAIVAATFVVYPEIDN